MQHKGQKLESLNRQCLREGRQVNTRAHRVMLGRWMSLPLPCRADWAGPWSDGASVDPLPSDCRRLGPWLPRPHTWHTSHRSVKRNTYQDACPLGLDCYKESPSLLRKLHRIFKGHNIRSEPHVADNMYSSSRRNLVREMAPAAAGMFVGERGGDEPFAGGQRGLVALVQQQAAVLLQGPGPIQQLQRLEGVARPCPVGCG